MLMRARVFAGISVAILSHLAPSALEAQPDTAASGIVAERSLLCWRPRPSERCGGYLVTEMTVEKAVLSSSDDMDLRFVGTLGPMINRGRAEAWGVLFSIFTDDPDQLSLLRAEGRYRKWIGSASGIDLALGLTQHSGYDRFDAEVERRGVTAAVGIQQGLLGVHGRVDLLRAGGETESAAFVGVGLGGYAGPLAAAGLVVGFIGLFAIAMSGG